MATTPRRAIADFGTRSLLTHAIMAVSFLGAVLAGLYVDGEVGVIAFVAFAAFTAGMWICQSIHSLGNAVAGTGYDGVLNEVREYGR